jgi:hypothetical protein
MALTRLSGENNRSLVLFLKRVIVPEQRGLPSNPIFSPSDMSCLLLGTIALIISARLSSSERKADTTDI